MSDLDDLLDQLLRTFPEHAGSGPNGVASQRLERAGLLDVGRPEEFGGQGGELRDAATVAIRVAEAGVDLPLVEHLFTGPLQEQRPDEITATPYVAALGRSCELLGSVRSVVRLTGEHVRLREQFGRPLTAFQVARHHVAALLCELAAAETAVAHAIDVVDTLLALADDPHPSLRLAVAAAKVQTSRSATSVARTAHQLHGAVGMTAEHPLHVFTRRLWAGRDQDGSAEHWSTVTLRLVHTAYGGDLWAALTDQSTHSSTERSH
jgi:alkylation response protein AidB-like acyl-CoA dehydrogenase